MDHAEHGREYQPGDRVRRKLDGRPMTVEEVYSPFYTYRLKCSWGDDSRKMSDLYRLDQVEPDRAE